MSVGDRVLKVAKVKVDEDLIVELQAVSNLFVDCRLSTNENGFTVTLDGGANGGATREFSSLASAESVFEQIRGTCLTSPQMDTMGFKRWLSW